MTHGVWLSSRLTFQTCSSSRPFVIYACMWGYEDRKIWEAGGQAGEIGDGEEKPGEAQTRIFAPRLSPDGCRTQYCRRRQNWNFSSPTFTEFPFRPRAALMDTEHFSAKLKHSLKFHLSIISSAFFVNTEHCPQTDIILFFSDLLNSQCIDI